MYQVMEADGLDESVMHVNVIVLSPFASTSSLPLMFV